MARTLEIRDDLMERIERHLEVAETPAEFIAELVAMCETEGAVLREGYSELARRCWPSRPAYPLA